LALEPNGVLLAGLGSTGPRPALNPAIQRLLRQDGGAASAVAFTFQPERMHWPTPIDESQSLMAYYITPLVVSDHEGVRAPKRQGQSRHRRRAFARARLRTNSWALTSAYRSKSVLPSWEISTATA
jgi:hypothetical protein